MCPPANLLPLLPEASFYPFFEANTILNPKATSDFQSWKRSLLPLNFKSILCGSFKWFFKWHIWLLACITITHIYFISPPNRVPWGWRHHSPGPPPTFYFHSSKWQSLLHIAQIDLCKIKIRSCSFSTRKVLMTSCHTQNKNPNSLPWPARPHNSRNPL